MVEGVAGWFFPQMDLWFRVVPINPPPFFTSRTYSNLVGTLQAPNGMILFLIYPVTNLRLLIEPRKWTRRTLCSFGFILAWQVTLSVSRADGRSDPKPWERRIDLKLARCHSRSLGGYEWFLSWTKAIRFRFDKHCLSVTVIAAWVCDIYCQDTIQGFCVWQVLQGLLIHCMQKYWDENDDRDQR